MLFLLRGAQSSVRLVRAPCALSTVKPPRLFPFFSPRLVDRRFSLFKPRLEGRKMAAQEGDDMKAKSLEPHEDASVEERWEAWYAEQELEERRRNEVPALPSHDEVETASEGVVRYIVDLLERDMPKGKYFYLSKKQAVEVAKCINLDDLSIPPPPAPADVAQAVSWRKHDHEEVVEERAVLQDQMVKRTQLQKKKLRLAWTLIKHLETVKQTRVLRDEGSPSVRAEMGSIERLLTVECAAVNEAGLNDKQLTQFVKKLMKCVEAEKIDEWLRIKRSMERDIWSVEYSIAEVENWRSEKPVDYY